MALQRAANRLHESEVRHASTALSTLLAASCHAPSLDHQQRMDAHAAVMRLITFSARELALRKRRAAMRRRAREQAYEAHVAERWEAEQLAAALQAERVSDLLYGERDFATD